MIDPVDIVNPPPTPVIGNYPGIMAAGAAVLLTAILLVVSNRFDSTKGPLTISILIIVAFMGTVAYCLIFTVPTDEVTPSVVGGLTAGFGAVVAHWLGRVQHGPGRRPPEETPDQDEGAPRADV